MPTTPPSTRPRPATAAALTGLAVLVAIVCVLVTGCASPEPSPREDPVDQRAELLARPSLEEMTTRYQQMQARIRAEVDTVLGPQQWQQFDPPAQTPCGFDFPDENDGRAFSLGLYGFPAAIPDNRWPQVEQAVLTVARDYGFTDPAGLRIDQPGHHLTGAIDHRLGANLSIETEATTALSISSGCHLPATSKPGT